MTDSATSDQADLLRKFAAELLGTAMLLAAVVGSGMMGERLAAGNIALALFSNSVATGAALAAIIMTFGPISGAHLNPVVTLSNAIQKELAWDNVPIYVIAQILGAFLGVAVANVMFGLPFFSVSQNARAGFPQLFSECVATFGLLGVVRGCVGRRASAAAVAVAAYITAAYWFTASTSFANPAVTFARAATNTFTGIRPVDVPGFVVAQLLGGAIATVLFQWLIPSLPVRGDPGFLSHQTAKKYGK